jgi:hypothetical protein
VRSIGHPDARQLVGGHSVHDMQVQLLSLKGGSVLPQPQALNARKQPQLGPGGGKEQGHAAGMHAGPAAQVRM